jgi:amidase
VDGGKDILDACKLSGEPIIPNLANVITPDAPAITINQLWDLQLERTSYQKKMLEAWKETAKRTKNGKSIDAFIAPIAPFAAVAHNQYDHVFYTSWVYPPTTSHSHIPSN